MDIDALQATLQQWLATYPHWVGAAIFIISFLESTAIIGIILPGVVLLSATGFMAGSGALSLLPALACAAAGGTLGDCFSYWLGHRYHQGIKRIWPFSRYPEMIARGEDFFREQGAYGVILGRFIGPLRPVVPMAAGMLNMPVRQFVFVDVISACAWAPLYVGPGYLLGASIKLDWPLHYLGFAVVGAVLLLMLLPRLKRRLQQ